MELFLTEADFFWHGSINYLPAMKAPSTSVEGPLEGHYSMPHGLERTVIGKAINYSDKNPVAEYELPLSQCSYLLHIQRLVGSRKDRPLSRCRIAEGIAQKRCRLGNLD